MKKLLSIMIISISGAYAGDWGEFNRQQAEWQAAFDRQQAAYERQEAEWQRQFDQRQQRIKAERQHQDILDAINRDRFYDFE